MLWKSWRDLRLFVWIGLGWLGVVAGAIVYAHLRGSAEAHISTTSTAGEAAHVTAPLVAGLIFIQMAFVLLAWSMGTVGIGRDLGHGAGSWMLTRPTPRARFVWSEWASGLAVLALLLALAEFMWWLATRLHIFRFVVESSNSTAMPTPIQPAFPSGFATAASLCVFLFLALIFSVTHCGTVSLRHSTRGLIFCLGFLVVYGILFHEVAQYGPAWLPRLPDLFLDPSAGGGPPIAYRPHLASSILERLAVLPLFPLIAQLFLWRAEV
jgi:hypothetical protein